MPDVVFGILVQIERTLGAAHTKIVPLHIPYPSARDSPTLLYCLDIISLPVPDERLWEEPKARGFHTDHLAPAIVQLARAA